jgi:GT2 family glycosyltransferase
MTDVGTEKPVVAIVVVGYNDKGVVCDCLRSLRRLDYRPTLVIYVDNDSTDGTLEAVRAEFPEAIALASGGNLGYCGGNNVGIARALESGAAYVLILNPDTIVWNSAFVTELVDYMTAHTTVGKLGPKVFLRQPGVVQNTILDWPTIAGSFLSVLGKLVPGQRTPRSEAVTAPTTVPSLNGCCLLVRAEALRDVGLYDESLWGYVDEVDWDWQAERAGWQRHYVPVESIVHMQKADGYDFASRTNYFIKRNTARWYAKTGKWVSMTVWMVITLVIAVIRAIFAPLFGRPSLEYFRFICKLAAGYAAVLADLVRGRLPTSSLPGLPPRKLLQERVGG